MRRPQCLASLHIYQSCISSLIASSLIACEFFATLLTSPLVHSFTGCSYVVFKKVASVRAILDRDPGRPLELPLPGPAE